MKEELQSTHEELQGINDVIRGRESELDEASGFLHSVLSSLRSGVIALDRELLVTGWNDRSTDFWGTRPGEAVGRNFFTLYIGLPAEALHVPIRACISGESTGEHLSVGAINRRGRPMQCDVWCFPLRRENTVRGVLIMMEETHAPIAS